MVEPSVANSSPGGSECERSTVELSTGSESEFGSLVDDLIESREDVVSELNLSNSVVPCSSQSYCEPSNSLFTYWSIENSIDSVLFNQPTGASENSTEFYILPEHFCTKFNMFCTFGPFTMQCRWLSSPPQTDSCVFVGLCQGCPWRRYT